jgi:hypothetical protein
MERKTYRIIDRDNEIAIIEINHHIEVRASFISKGQLLTFLHNKFITDEYRKGYDNLVECNWLLLKCCHNWNDCFYTWKNNYEDGVCVNTSKITNYYEYMILDPYDRIMNIPDLAIISFKFKKDIDLPFKRKYYNFKNDEWERYKRRSPAYFEGGGYYRQMNVQQERRMSCDPTHKPYVRCKRNAKHLDPYDIEKTACSESGWKIMKLRKQFMENQKICRTKKKNYRSIKRMVKQCI